MRDSAGFQGTFRAKTAVFRACDRDQAGWWRLALESLGFGVGGPIRAKCSLGSGVAEQTANSRNGRNVKGLDMVAAKIWFRVRSPVPSSVPSSRFPQKTGVSDLIPDSRTRNFCPATSNNSPVGHFGVGRILILRELEETICERWHWLRRSNREPMRRSRASVWL